MSPDFKMQRTTISLESDDILRLAAIVTDEDEDEALKFVQEVIASKIECAQAARHHTAFEGDSGHSPAHYTQKGEGMHAPHEHGE
jgi:hypothetical protein